jgi:hypothetical protein
LAWLSVHIGLNVIAGTVIACYQDTLSQAVSLAVLLSIISEMSGCSGGQAVAVSPRELAVSLARPNEVVRVWLREVLIEADSDERHRQVRLLSAPLPCSSAPVFAAALLFRLIAVW